MLLYTRISGLKKLINFMVTCLVVAIVWVTLWLLLFLRYMYIEGVTPYMSYNGYKIHQKQ